MRAVCAGVFFIWSYIDGRMWVTEMGRDFLGDDLPPDEINIIEEGKNYGWPKDYQNNLLVAYHGSWNRTEPTGYKVVRYKLDERGNYLDEEDFISGWLTEDGALGRKVDILVRSEGVLYISDDKAGVIYKVEYKDNEV